MSEPIDELRQAVAAVPAPPAGMARYLAKVRERAYMVVERDVTGLLDDGFTEDEIFEQTVAVAVAEGLRRLDRADEVIG